jgi:hypothetical protein
MNALGFGIIVSGFLFMVVAIAVVVNLVWGDERERAQTKSMLVQLAGGLSLAAGAILVINFLVKPCLAWIGTFLSKLF